MIKMKNNKKIKIEDFLKIKKNKGVRLGNELKTYIECFSRMNNFSRINKIEEKNRLNVVIKEYIPNKPENIYNIKYAIVVNNKGETVIKILREPPFCFDPETDFYNCCFTLDAINEYHSKRKLNKKLGFEHFIFEKYFK